MDGDPALTWSPSRVMQSSSFSRATRAPTLRSLTSIDLRKTCATAGVNFSSYLSTFLLIIGRQSSGAGGKLPGRRRLSGMKVTRPAFAFCSSVRICAAVSSARGGQAS